MNSPSPGFQVDHDDNSPLYKQLARKLAQDVRDGRYQADQALPSERMLSEQLDVSRVTARKAIDQLVDQGLVVRRRGSGNYIAPRIEQPLSTLSSFSEQLQQRGYTPRSQWLRRDTMLADADEQLSLGLSPGARVARLERLRLADDIVMAYEVSVIPASRAAAPRAGGSVAVRAPVQDRPPAGARAAAHPRDECRPGTGRRGSSVPEGRAVLFITRVGYLESGQPVELTHSYCRSDHYDFVAELRRQA